MKLVRITWVDVHNVAGGWHDDDELATFAKSEAYKVTSIGYQVYEDGLCVVLCSRYAPESEEFGQHFGMVERIPKKLWDEHEVLLDEREAFKIDYSIEVNPYLLEKSS